MGCHFIHSKPKALEEAHDVCLLQLYQKAAVYDTAFSLHVMVIDDLKPVMINLCTKKNVKSNGFHRFF